jgi:hypothetical protein
LQIKRHRHRDDLDTTPRLACSWQFPELQFTVFNLGDGGLDQFTTNQSLLSNLNLSQLPKRRLSSVMPPWPSVHHCKCGKSTKRAANLGYCPKCSGTCEGVGSATTKGGVVRPITHKKWVKYQTESCTACEEARKAIEKTN